MQAFAAALVRNRGAL